MQMIAAQEEVDQLEGLKEKKTENKKIFQIIILLVTAGFFFALDLTCSRKDGKDEKIEELREHRKTCCQLRCKRRDGTTPSPREKDFIKRIRDNLYRRQEG